MEIGCVLPRGICGRGAMVRHLASKEHPSQIGSLTCLHPDMNYDGDSEPAVPGDQEAVDRI